MSVMFASLGRVGLSARATSRFTTWCRGAFLTAAVVCAGAVVAEPVAVRAQDIFAEPSARQKRTVRRSRPAADPYGLFSTPVQRRPSPVRTAAPRPAAPKPQQPAKPVAVPKVDPTREKGPETLVAVISLASQRMHVYGADGVVGETRISSGTAGHRTPTGVFSVLQRNRFHRSNIYSGAPMPYMQRLTWSGIALHEGVVPGYPASHGCVRMPSGFASRMWGLGRIGMRVLVSPTDIAPEAIEHPRLPVPVMTRLEATAAGDPVAVVVPTSVGDPPAAERQDRPVPPFAFAQVRRVRAIAAQAAAEKELKAAEEALTTLSAAANRAADALRKAEADLAALETETTEMEAAIGRANGPAVAELRAMLVSLVERRDAARTARDEMRKSEHRASDASFDAAKALRVAQERADEAVTAVRLAAASLEPVSIFISRKEGKVFVRQGFTPIHEEEITFSEPERPLGTHVFTAIDVTAEGAGLRWLVTTLPSGSHAADPEPRRRGAQPPKPAPSAPPSNARDVLDRFELPEATVKLIGDRLWNGATLIVSDYGISGETGRGTDFVVLTK